MEDEFKFKVETIMEKEDYRRYLYLATFRKSPAIMILIFLIAFLGTFVFALSDGTRNPIVLSGWSAFFLFVAFITICIKLEIIYRRRLKTDRIGTFDMKQTIYFYAEKLKIETPSIEGSNMISYEKFYRLLESKDFFIMYYSSNLASIIRKKDLKDMEEIQALSLFLKSKFENCYRKLR